MQVATPVARAGRAVPRCCATTSTGWSAGSTATSAGSAARRSPTCTRPTRARRWPRSTGPPTSCWSRRCRDGMNLVAKEYVACRYDDDGALVLSEFAGAADELRQAFLVNPHDIDGMKAALLEAYRADDRDLTRRMRAMRKTISRARRRGLGAAVPRGDGRGAARPRQDAAARPTRPERRRASPSPPTTRFSTSTACTAGCPRTPTGRSAGRARPSRRQPAPLGQRRRLRRTADVGRSASCASSPTGRPSPGSATCTSTRPRAARASARR